MISPADEDINTISEKALDTALDTIKRFCLAHRLTVAVAESVSSGYLQMLFGSVEGAGLFFEGGITSYSCQQKEDHFDIPLEICDLCFGVSLDISQRMALKIGDQFNAKLTLSLTGFASPIPEHQLYDLYAFGCIVLNGKVIFGGKMLSNQQDADEIREDYARQLVMECSKLLNINLVQAGTGRAD